MSQATDYLEAELLDHIFGIGSWSAPATLYLALFTDNPGEAAGGTEVAGGSYARIAITNDATSWSRAGKIITNDNLLVATTASASWGTVTHWVLFDASSGGNRLFYGALPNPVAVGIGATFRVGAGLLSITFNAKSDYMAGSLLDHIFGITPFSAPANVYVALFTANPTDAGGGTEVTTVGTDYARSEVLNDATSWSRTDNIVENDNDIDYPEAAANYGSVTGQGAFDADPAGNLLWWAPLTPPQTINTGSQFAFTPGQYRYVLD